MNAIAIAVDDLCARVGKRVLLGGITLDLEQHRVLSVIGPSGCGKSTFLRCLNRMHELTVDGAVTGSVRVFGDDVYALGVDAVKVRRRVGLVMQQPTVFSHLTIRENLLVGLRLAGTVPEDTDPIVDRCLARVALARPLADRLDEPATTLSAGERQRLCIARALAVQPDVLLLDEPTASLDPIATAHIEELIDELKRSYTLVVVTHSMQQAIRISDDTLFINQGRSVEHGPTHRLFSQPVAQETEEFVTGRFG